MKDVKINPINIIRFKLNNKPTRNICHNLIVIYKFTTELYPFKYNKFNCLNNHYSLVSYLIQQKYRTKKLHRNYSVSTKLLLVIEVK